MILAQKLIVSSEFHHNQPRKMNIPSSHKQEREKQRVKARLEGFDSKSSPVWVTITERFGPDVTHTELITLAIILAQKAGIVLDRDAKRRKQVLVKWFEEHWTEILPFVHLIALEDAGPVAT
jgi:hypothetical protein